MRFVLLALAGELYDGVWKGEGAPASPHAIVLLEDGRHVTPRHSMSLPLGTPRLTPRHSMSLPLETPRLPPRHPTSLDVTATWDLSPRPTYNPRASLASLRYSSAKTA